MMKSKRMLYLTLLLMLSLMLTGCGEKTETSFYSVNDISYPAELGAPILGEDAAALIDSATYYEAMQKITNVGDAFHYLAAIGEFSQPHEVSRMFVDLLVSDYDEVGLIYLERPDMEYCVAYIKSGENYYPFDPFSMEGAWTLDPRHDCISDADLDALCEKLMTTIPYNPDGKPMTSWRVEPIRTTHEQVVAQAKFMERKYTDTELQAFVEESLSFEEACEKISTVSDAVQYLYLRGYHFESEEAGIEAQLRYELNSGACVGGSALFNALLEGDYDAQGYVYIFYAKGEHVFDYFVSDGVYYFCDFVSVFHSEGVKLHTSPICHVTTDPSTIYEAWLEIEPHDLNDSSSDLYLAAMYTTAYYGDPSMSTTRLIDTPEGNYAHIPLSDDESLSQNILFLREGYTFEFD